MMRFKIHKPQIVTIEIEYEPNRFKRMGIRLTHTFKAVLKLLSKRSGCLEGKTPEMKEDFFNSLLRFATYDVEFYKEQYLDLLPAERIEFYKWLLKSMAHGRSRAILYLRQAEDLPV